MKEMPDRQRGLAGERHLGHDLPRRIDDLERRLRVRLGFLDGAVEQDLGTGLARVGDRLIQIGKVDPLRSVSRPEGDLTLKK